MPRDLLWLREEFPGLGAQETFDAWSRIRQIKFSTAGGFAFLFIGIWLSVAAKEEGGLLGASMVSAATVLFGTAARFWGLSASGFAQLVKAAKNSGENTGADKKVKS